VAFFDGRPVDMFQGAIPQGQIKEFIDRLTALAGDDGGLAEAVEAAEQMLAEGAAIEAAQVFSGILGEEPEHAGATGGLARAHLAMGEIDKAEGILNTAPDAIMQAPELEAVRAQIALARQAEKAGPLAELQAAVEANPSDQQARFDYALALHASGQVQEAVDQLLDLFRRDRDWNDGAAKAQLFTIFDALKPQDPIVLAGRRRLSSMIFA
jgi:putative thioredoxin